MEDIVNFLFEVGILSKTPRSGFHFLGSGNQSVAEHINRVVFIGYTLASMEKDVDMLKILKMCFLHDLHESRISDLNYIHQKYIKPETRKAVDDLAKSLPFGKDMKEIVEEYEERKSKEAIITKDADNLEWILSLKEQYDSGNNKAMEWIFPAIKRLKTENAQKIAQVIMDSNSDDWWFKDKEGDWWVNRNK
ncbi:MAG TPA: HD domain-containing protein [Candidatus Nanoarchaeia archaeon]|nr:HD domain-containing protein [Candidatus Nanoarchaeia archaeon]